MTWLASLICGISFFSGASFCEKPNLAAAPFVFTVGQGGTATSVSPIAGDLLMSWKAGSYGPTSLIAGSNITISTSTYKQITISSTASGGSGNVSTSSVPVIGNLSFWTTDTATPALLGTVATTTLTASSPLSLSNPVAKVGGSNSALTLDTSGAWSGTAGSLAADGANCSAGNFPLGVSTVGASQDCTDAWTEAENTSAGYTSNTGTVTSIATTFPILGGTITTTGTLTFGGLSTSSAAVVGNIPYFSGVNTFANVATSSLTINAPLTTVGTLGSLVGGTALTIDIDDIKAADLDLTDITLDDFTNDAGFITGIAWGSITGTLANQSDLSAALYNKIGTSTTLTTGQLLYATGANTSSSVATGTISVPTGLTITANRSAIGGAAAIGLDTGYVIPLQSTLDAKVDESTTITVSGTGSQITSSAGAQDLSTNRTWTLSLPNHVIFPSSFQAALSSSTAATSTTFAITSITSAIPLAAADGSLQEYAGTSCTNQFVRSLNGAGVATCADVVLATDTTGNFVATVTSSGSITVANSGAENAAVTVNLNMANANTWTALQTFANATTTLLSASYASSTNWYGGGLLNTCASGSFLTWTAGVFGCDTDDTTAGADDFTFETNFATINAATSSMLWAKSGLNASSTSQFDNATSTLFTATTAWLTNLFIGADTIAEYIADTAGAMFTGNTETGITVTYQDADNTVDFTVANLEDLAGTLDVASGGTGVTSFTANSLLYSNSAGTALAYAATSSLNIGGNAGTATALFANGANCSSGNSPLGVDASGAVENCFDVWTEAENTSAGYTSNTGTVTSIATTWPILGGTITTTGTLTFGGLSTSTAAVVSNIPYFSGVNTFANVATTTLTASSPLSFDNPVAKVGGSNSILTLDTSGAWSGTAGSLAANGANCSSGNAPLGVNALGAVENCFDVWTEAENTSAGYVALTGLSATSPIIYNSGTGAFSWVGLATTSQPASSNLLVSNGGAGVYGVATTSITCSGDISCTGFNALGANSEITFTGSYENPLTFTYPLTRSTNTISLAFGTTTANTWAELQTFSNGIDVGGTTFTSLIPTTRQLTVAGTANQLTSSAGAQDLSANRTWTLSLPNHVIFPSSFQVGSASTTNATSTNQDITGLLTFNGVTASTWAAFCETITGGAGLCDGSDATGSGIDGFDFDYSQDIGYGLTGSATSTKTQFTLGIHASSTSHFSNATTTLLSGTTAWFTEFIGSLTGNADTATALAADPADCSAGSYALGINTSGAAQGCTDATTEIDSAISTHAGVAEAHQALVTLAGALDYITLVGQEITRNAIVLTTDVSGDLPFANLAQVSANSVLGNITPSTADATSIATSSLFSWTGTGLVARQDSPTFTAPVLGTIASGVGTALTALDGENIQNDTIDADSIDWTLVTIADLVGTQLSGAIAWDFGGATSLEIPNSAAPTVGAAGILALDTTSNNLILATSTAGHVVIGGATTTLYAFSVASTSPDMISGGSIGLPPHFLPQVATAIACKVDLGTSWVINLDDGVNNTNSITCTTTWTQYALTTNNSWTAGEQIRLEGGTLTGAVDYTVIRILGYRTSD